MSKLYQIVNKETQAGGGAFYTRENVHIPRVGWVDCIVPQTGKVLLPSRVLQESIAKPGVKLGDVKQNEKQFRYEGTARIYINEKTYFVEIDVEYVLRGIKTWLDVKQETAAAFALGALMSEINRRETELLSRTMAILRYYRTNHDLMVRDQKLSNSERNRSLTNQLERITDENR